MRLKHIKLAGFKSFVDPTTVTFPGNRCAVVGPNGCGKSNIIDAVRWVMGESSAKQLRGENLTDVIFNGSNTRKPTVMASIELFFDNSDHRIGGEYASYSEFAIRREVNREAQSNYFLNGSKCRRRDILDIFLGTGFGPRSYSIIEQGMISQLVEAKPDDLRLYLEEAAGISKYKERRRETENRIKHTRENLDRLNDIREELERQIAHLKRQARSAERYRALKDEERRVTAELHTVTLRGLNQALTEHQSQIAGWEIELERQAAEQRSMETRIEDGRSRHAETTEAFNGVQGRFYQLGADIARIEETIQFNAERVRQLELDLEAVHQRGDETGRQLAMDEAQIDGVKNAIADIVPRVRDARTADAQASETLATLEARQRDWQQRWDTFSARASENASGAEVQASRVEHLGQLLQRLRARSAQLESDEQGVPAPGGERADHLAREIDEAERRLGAAEADIDVCLKDLATAKEDVLRRERLLDDARVEVQDQRHELASLGAVQQAALGRDYSDTGEWMAANGLEDAVRLGEGLSVVPGWERAVETVLGHFLQALKVPELEGYVTPLQALPAGQVALVQGRTPPQPGRSDLPTLAAMVRSDGIGLGSLLHGVYVAESPDVAMAHRLELIPGESIITRGGLWVGPDWMRMIAPDDGETGIIERAQALDTLKLRVEQAETGLAELQRDLREGRERVEQLEQERAALQARTTELGTRLASLKADHGVHQVRQEEAQARRHRLAAERSELAGQIAEEQRALDDARRHLAEAEAERERLDEERRDLTAHRDSEQRALDAARQQARNARDAYHRQNADWQKLQSQLSAGETARERLLAQQRELDDRRASLRSGIDASASPLPALQQELETTLGNRQAVDDELADVRRRLESIDHEIRELESGRSEVAERIVGLREQLEQARVEREGISVQRNTAMGQLQATGHDFETVDAELDADADPAEWQGKLERQANRITRLGPINLAAIDEYETQSERKSYLDAQHQDLTEALETLGVAIRKIDRETRSRFKATFDEVNARLGTLFPKVFGGGHAYLEMTGEDLLDTGVTLMARPPGKRNSSVHLLSGGEKALTAVALIFAIFQLNPSPVCLLDEVDAPLDDSNVVRFANLIKDMSADVQFVVITHNKLTMEMADHLMGVTMNEPGVSRLVSVDVEEAVALAAV